MGVFYLVTPHIDVSLVSSSTCSYKILLHTYWNDFNNNSIFFFCKYIILWLQTTLFFCSHIFFDVGALHLYVFALYWSIPRSVVCRLLADLESMEQYYYSSFMHYSFYMLSARIPCTCSTVTMWSWTWYITITLYFSSNFF